MFRKPVLWMLLVALIFAPIYAIAQSGFSTDAQAVDKAAKSVLMLEVYDNNDEYIASGSGFVAFNNRMLVTNYHVIENAAYIVGWSDDGYKYIIDKVYAVDEKADLAILGFFSPSDIPPLALGTNSEIMRIDPVVTIGSPQGSLNSISVGNVSSVYECDGVQYIQFTAPISGGSSGGALFNNSGEVIGITTMYFGDQSAQNMNLAVHILEAVKLYQNTNENKWVSLEEYNGGVVASTNPPEVTEKPTSDLTPKPTPTLTPVFYPILRFGDRGVDVQRLQQALIGLGYLEGEADGVFGKKTKQAVQEFSTANAVPGGEGTDGVATSRVQQILYGPNPKRYNDTQFALIMPINGYGQVVSYEDEDDLAEFTFQVENTAKKKVVKAFEISIFALDVWDNEIYGDYVVLVTTIIQRVAPGETVYVQPFPVPQFSEVDELYIGIGKISYADGTVEEISDIEYYYWTFQ